MWMGGSSFRRFSRTLSGSTAMTREVSYAPAWHSPRRYSSVSVFAHLDRVVSTKTGRTPVRVSTAATALWSASRWAGSRWALARATFFSPWPITEQAMSRTRAVVVSGEIETRPAKPAANSVAAYEIGGRIRDGTPRALSFIAARRAISVAITTSVSRGRCGPCGSMAPSGRITTGDFAKASPASHQVRSPRFSIQRFISVATPRAAPPSRQGRSRAEPLAVDLPAIVPREGIRELDLARVLVGREAPLDELLQVAGEGLARGLAGAQDDERLRLHEPRLVAPADDGALEDGGVAEEAVLDLDGGHEGASHLEEVVAAPAVVVEALGVAAEEVPAHGPVAPEGRARLVAVVPVAERRRAPAHPEGAELPGGDVVSVGADEPRLVARDDAAEGSRSDLAEAVRDVDVEHLGRADPVEDLDAEGLLPAAVELGGERR